MGLPFEQWRGGDADSAAGKDSGCRTPGSGHQQGAASGECPAAPRKRRPGPAGAVSQQRRDYYNGADVDDFFAAHNL